MRGTVILAIVVSIGGLSAGSLRADEFQWPSRKPGQWELHMKAGDSMPEMTMQMCLDAATDKGMMQVGLGMAKSMCPNQTTAREGALIVIDSTCEVGGMKIKSRTEISGDFQSEYTMVVKGDIADAPEGMPNTTAMEHKARWVSATCADGMTPGDIEMPGGIKMNMQKMMGVMNSLGEALGDKQ